MSPVSLSAQRHADKLRAPQATVGFIGLLASGRSETPSASEL
jgi:hypothetical protein